MIKKKLIIFLILVSSKSANCTSRDWALLAGSQDSIRVIDTLLMKEEREYYFYKRYFFIYCRKGNSYYISGNKKKRGKFSKWGFKTGIWKYYYESGKLHSKGRYKRNTHHGKWIFYYESGAIKAKGNMYYGEMKGVWKLYNEEGNVTIVNYE